MVALFIYRKQRLLQVKLKAFLARDGGGEGVGWGWGAVLVTDSSVRHRSR